MRVVRSQHAHGDIVVDRCRGRARDAGRRRGVDRRGHPRSAADRFPRSRAQGAAALSSAGARAGPRALCRRAGRRCLRRARLSRGRRGRARRRRDRGAARAPRRLRRRRASSRRAFQPSPSRCRAAYGDLDARVRVGARMSSSSSSRSAAIRARRSRRAARLRATTARATCSSSTARPRSRTARATISRASWDAHPTSVHLKEGHTGGGFGIRGELYPEDVLVSVAALQIRSAGEMDRGSARASDGRQSLARAAPSRARRRRRGRPRARARRRLLPQPGRLHPHARRARARSHQLDGAGPLSRARLSLGRAFPAHQQDARRDLSRARAASKARSCASA